MPAIAKALAEPVEAERPGERDHVAAIDQPPAEPGVLGGQAVEMDLGGVLEQARGDLVLGLLDGHAVDVVDLLAHRVIGEAVRAAGEIRDRRRRPSSVGRAPARSGGSTTLARLGTCSSAIAASGSRLRTSTQRQ